MSWMDSWSRPKKSSAVPPPLYLTAGDNVQYCKTCGRVMSSKKPPQPSTKPTKNPNIVKYCSTKCRTRKPTPLDRRIESRIASLLNAAPDSGIEATTARSKLVKGDKRLLVTMTEIESLFFERAPDPQKVFGRRKNRASRALGAEEGEWRSVDMESSSGEEEDGDGHDEEGGVELGKGGGVELYALEKGRVGPLVRPEQSASAVNGSIGGEKGWAERQEESEVAMSKRSEGNKRAEEREMVRRAARRGVVFGFVVEGEEEEVREKVSKGQKGKGVHQPEEGDEPRRRKCEAVMQGQVVEPSFAKGDWGIRWRE